MAQDDFLSQLTAFASESPDTTAAPAPQRAARSSGPFDAAAAFTLGEEGGYVANDAGRGETNFGINKSANPDVDVKALTPEGAKALYRTRYWDAIDGDSVAKKNPALALVAFDTAINMGAPTARLMLRASGGDPAKLLELRQARYEDLLAADPKKYGPYAKSWASRMDKLSGLVGADAAERGPDADGVPQNHPDYYVPERDRWATGQAPDPDQDMSFTGRVAAGAKRGWDQSLGLGAAGAALLNRSITGAADNEFQRQALDYAGRKLEEGQAGATSPSFLEAAFGDASFKDWLGESIGYVGYQVAESVLTGGAGGLLAKTVGKEAVQTVATSLVKEEVERLAKTEAAKKLTAEQLLQTAAGNVTGRIGAGTSVFLNNLRQTAGGVYGEALDQEGKTGEPLDLANIWTASVASAGFETAADMAAAKGMLGLGHGSSAPSYLGRLARETPRQMGVQGGTEFTQSLIETAGAGKDPFTSQQLLQAVDEGAVGALGGAMAAPLSALHQAAAKPDSPLARAATAGTDATQQMVPPPAEPTRLSDAERLAELEAITAPQPERVITHPDGSTTTVAAHPGRFFTPEEAEEHQRLVALRDATPGHQVDALADRVKAVQEQAQQAQLMDRLRGPNPLIPVKDALKDMATAANTKADPAVREEALGRLEALMAWMGQGAPEVPKMAPDPVEQGQPTDVVSEALRDPQLAPRISPTDRDQLVQLSAIATSELANEVQRNNALTQAREILGRYQAAATPAPAARAPATGASLLSAPPAPPPAPVQPTVGTTPEGQQASAAAAARVAQLEEEDGQAGAAQASPTQGQLVANKVAAHAANDVNRDRVAQLAEEDGNAAPAPAPVPPAPKPVPPMPPAPPAPVELPRATAAQSTAGSTQPAYIRKRRAQLDALAAQGFERVEKREDGSWYFVNPKTRQALQLENAAEAQLARAADQAKRNRQASENLERDPSAAKVKANNYAKGHTTFDGLDLSIENDVGSTRRNKNPEGPKWEVTMTAHYGDVKGTRGKDGDPVDVYVPDDARPGSPVFVIDQYNDDGTFDEHKAVLGVSTPARAQQIYDAHFSDGSGPRRRRGIRQMTMDEFRSWVKSDATQKPAAPVSETKAPTPEPKAAPAPAATPALDAADDPGAGIAPVGDIAEAVDDPYKPGTVIHVTARGHTLRAVDDSKFPAKAEIAAAKGSRTKVTKKQANKLRLVAGLFGKRVVFFEGSRDDGFTLKKTDPGVIFINRDTQISPLAVLGHEMLHLLATDNPTAYKALAAVVRRHVKDAKGFRGDYHGRWVAKNASGLVVGTFHEEGAAREAVKSLLGATIEEQSDAPLSDVDLEEIVADLGGNLLKEAKFWREVFDEAKDLAGDTAPSIIARLAAFLNNVLDKALEAFKGQRQFAADRFIDDLKAVRGAMRDALKIYLIQQGASMKDKAEIQRETAKASKSTLRPQRQADPSPEYGIHFSRQQRTVLSGGMYGTGLKGAEAQRLAETDDARLKSRTYFYVDEGNGVRPEAGVGGIAHRVKLPKLYDLKADPLNLWSADINAAESRILDAGFDGYFVKKHETGQGFAVVIGPASYALKAEPIEAPRMDAKPAAPVAPQPVRKGLMSRELNAIDLERIPGAKLKMGDLIVPPESFEAANEEMARIGSNVRFSQRRADFDDSRDRTEVSTTVPRAKKGGALVNDAVEQKWVIDAEDVRQSEKHRAAVEEAIRRYNAVRVDKKADAIEALHKAVVDNLVWLHEKMPPAVRERAKLWYDGANRIANELAERYDIDPRQVAGVLAVLSPQKDWFMNVTMGERLIKVFMDHGTEAWSPAMTDWVRSYVAAAKTVDEKANRQKLLQEVEGLEGKTLAQMSDREAARFIRVFDETYHPRSYRVVTPEGGFGEYVAPGINDALEADLANDDEVEPGSVAWGTFPSIEKGVSILRNGARDNLFRNLSEQLGDEHKVRNFYNNIIKPDSADGHVTIDTHAVAAAFIKALSGAATEVKDNFGAAGSNAATGASGLYGVFADAYREAAARVGILAREMQSITWEAIRSIFQPSFKTRRARDIETIWDRFKAGEISREQARQEAYELGGGVKTLPWESTPEGRFVTEGGTSFDGELGADPAERKARTLEPASAKDSVRVSLSSATGTIPGLAELHRRAGKGDLLAHQLLQDIALDALQHLLSGTSARLAVDRATGLYGGQAEPSLGLKITFTDSDRERVLAALAKFAENFNQEQIHVRQKTRARVGTQFADGSYATPVYRWTLKQALERRQIQRVIDKSGLYGLTFGEDFVEAYYVGDPRDEQAQDEFDESIHRAAGLLGPSARGLEQQVARLWAYGDGDGGIGWVGVRRDLSPAPSLSSATARRVAGYLNAVDGQLAKIKVFEQAADIPAGQAELQREIARVYESLPDNDLKNPRVKRAYAELAKEVLRQFKALPVKLEVFKGQGEPYKSSADMRRDVLDNNHLFIFATTPETFGPAGADFTGHPLLEPTGLVDQKGHDLLFNDLLRAVHDYYAHTMASTQFGPKGEEAAWKNHMAMTGNMWARWALTSETRGQNSWVNFRDSLDPATPVKDRPFARQKAALMPIEYTLTGNAAVDRAMKAFIKELPEGQRIGSKPITRSTERADDLFGGFADKRSSITREVVTSSRGDTSKLRLGNTDSAGNRITGTKQGLQRFWDWFGDSQAADDEGRPLVLYHATNGDVSRFEAGRETTNGYGLLGNVAVRRGAIFMSPDIEMSEQYLREGDGGNVMPLYASVQNPADLRRGISHELYEQLTERGVNGRWLTSDMNTWEMFDLEEDGGNVFIDALREAGYDGAMFYEVGPDDGKPHLTYAVFDDAQLKSAVGNRGTFSEGEGLTRSSERAEIPVQLDGREVPLTLSGLDAARGHQLVRANVEAVERLYSQDERMYVGPGGEGGTHGRYERFGEFQRDAKSINAPYMTVWDQRVGFGDGRHRWAWMRDHGLKTIPVAMDPEEIPAARRMGLIEPPTLEEFAKDLKDKVAARRAYAEMLSGQHDWTHQVGDTLFSTKTGKSFEIVGRSFTGQGEKVKSGKLVPTYAVRDSDGLTNLWREDRLTADKNITSLTRPFTRSSERAPLWRSPLAEALGSVPERLAHMSAPQWLQWLKANAAKLGVKQDEIVWSGIEDYLKGRGKDKVARDELVRNMTWGGVQLRERVLGDEPPPHALTAEEAVQFLAEYSGQTPEWVRQYWGSDQELITMASQIGGPGETPSAAKFRHYRVPGGGRYNELLLTLAPPEPNFDLDDYIGELSDKHGWIEEGPGRRPGWTHDDLTPEELNKLTQLQERDRALRKKADEGHYKSSHWREHPDVLAHIRFDERRDTEGRPVLFLQEIQSDWGQDAKKKGFRIERSDLKTKQEPSIDFPELPQWVAYTEDEPTVWLGVGDTRDGALDDAESTLVAYNNVSRTPKGPFVGDTKSWVALALKRALKWAIDNGYKAVAIASGEQNARVFGLRHDINYLRYIPRGEGKYDVWAADSNGRSVSDALDWQGTNLEAVKVRLGDEAARMIAAGEGRQIPGETERVLDVRHLQLTVGGDGMMAFYDGIVPQVARDLAKKLGGEVKTIAVARPDAPSDEQRDLEVVGRADGFGFVIKDNNSGRFYAGPNRWVIEVDAAQLFDTMRPATRRMQELEQDGFSEPQPVPPMEALGIEVTDKMRKSAEAGMPLFSPERAGEEFEGLPTTNASGRRIAVTPQGLRRFWDWFGGSKMTDDEGRPRVLYHLTARDFEAFKAGGHDATISGPAIWLSPYEDHQPAGHSTGSRHSDFRDGSRVIPVYARIKMPLMIDDKNMLEWARDVYANGSEQFPQLLAPAWVQAIREDGYDGIVFDGPGVGWKGKTAEVIAFDGKQLKSVFSDDGGFDPDDGDFRRSTERDNATVKTDTPEFKQWFGDSVVTRNEAAGGDPQVVYHGTASSFSEFDPKKAGRNYGYRMGQRGFFFTNRPIPAGVYAEQAAGADFSDEARPRFGNGGANVMPVYLSLQDPYVRKAPGSPDEWLDQHIGELLAKADKLGADGLIVKGGRGFESRRVYVAFRPEQIKSSIANDGGFDPADPDITRSPSRLDAIRSLTLPANYQVGDFLTSNRSVSWWDKSVGTMYHLATKHPRFKRVYDRVQQFIGDVSFYATRAADMAPDILPKLEDLKDIRKTPLSAADVKALAAPIFEGTLNWTRDEQRNLVRTADVSVAGVVWTDDELRNMWRLDDRQIGLYRQARRAINKSLVDLGVTDMLHHVGEDGLAVREAVLRAPTLQAAEDILVNELERLAGLDPESAASLRKAIAVVKEKAHNVRGLIARGYAPLSRYGDHTVYVFRGEGENREQVYFGMFDSAASANQRAREMRELHPDAHVVAGTMSKEGYQLFHGINPDTLELFGDAMLAEGAISGDQRKMFDEHLALTKSNRSAIKRLITRKGIDGYSEDIGRVLAGFVYSNGRQASNNLHAGDIGKAVLAIKEEQPNNGDLLDMAVKLQQYVQNGQEEAQALRGLLFAQYIGGSVASALVNLTQTATTTWPTLGQHFGIGKAASALGQALETVRTRGAGDDDMERALKRAEQEGITAPQEVHHLMAQAQGKGALSTGDGTALGNSLAKVSNGMSKLSFVWGKLFGWAEAINRSIAFAAAYKLSRERGDADPYAFATDIVGQTQFVLNKGNNAMWARGPVGATLMTFRKFAVNYVEGLVRMWGNGTEGKIAAAHSLAILLLLAGWSGLPGAEDLDDVIDGIAQRVLGLNFQSKQARREWAAKHLGEATAGFLERGISGVPGVPLDVSGRLGLGNLVPGTGMLQKKLSYQYDVAEIFGAGGDFVTRALTAGGQLAQGDVANAALTLAPTAVTNAWKASEMARLGYYKDARNRKVIDTDLGEAVLKGIGFQPGAVARMQEATGTQAQLVALNKLREREISDLWVQGRVEKKPELVKDAQAQLKAWNQANPQSPIAIEPSQINRRVQQSLMAKAKRLEKTAPREIRKSVAEELAKARE